MNIAQRIRPNGLARSSRLPLAGPIALGHLQVTLIRRTLHRTNIVKKIALKHALLMGRWSNPFSSLESRSKDPRRSLLLLQPESEYRGSPTDLRERRTGTACSAARF